MVKLKPTLSTSYQTAHPITFSDNINKKNKARVRIEDKITQKQQAQQFKRSYEDTYLVQVQSPFVPSISKYQSKEQAPIFIERNSVKPSADGGNSPQASCSNSSKCFSNRSSNLSMPNNNTVVQKSRAKFQSINHMLKSSYDAQLTKNKKN